MQKYSVNSAVRRIDKRCHRNANPVAFELAIG